MNLSEVESRLNFVFPERHRQAILDPDDSIHQASDFLTLTVNICRAILQTNEFLRDPKSLDPWPDFLIAFASNGCGDYFAYDTRLAPPRIIYIDPDITIEENLQSTDQLCYESFEEWYKARFRKSRFFHK